MSIRFEEFSFDPLIGELVYDNRPGKPSIIRLAPQPSKLLNLLVDNYPEVVSHQKIKEEIWPEVQVDYERSLHFCIRQIRSALQERASSPRYIQTIPRKGYRWLVPPIANSSDSSIKQVSKRFKMTGTDKINEVKNADFRKSILQNWKRLLGISIPGFIILAIIAWQLNTAVCDNNMSGSDRALRIAIMPLLPEAETNQFRGNDIALRLVESLTNLGLKNYEIIGPTTTVKYGPGDLKTLIGDFKIDYIINGKFFQNDDAGRMLAEIIRANDGTHVWVKHFDAITKTDSIASVIQFGLLSIKE